MRELSHDGGNAGCPTPRRASGRRQLRRGEARRGTRSRLNGRGDREGRRGGRLRGRANPRGGQATVLAHAEGPPDARLCPTLRARPRVGADRCARSRARWGLRTRDPGRGVTDLPGGARGAASPTCGHERAHERGYHRRCRNRPVGGGRLGRGPLRRRQRLAGLRHRSHTRCRARAGAPHSRRGYGAQGRHRALGPGGRD